MLANTQRDGRPAEYRWRPLFNAAMFGWCRLLEYRAVTLPTAKSRNLAALPHGNISWGAPNYRTDLSR